MSDVLERLVEMDSGTTHWQGCEDTHIRCACQKEIRTLTTENERLRAEVAELKIPGELWPGSLVQKKIDSVRDAVETDHIIALCSNCNTGEWPYRQADVHSDGGWWKHGRYSICSADFIWERRYQRAAQRAALEEK